MPEGPLYAYRAKVAAGELRPDPAQNLAVEKLQSLSNAVAGYRPAHGRAGWLARFGFGTKSNRGGWAAMAEDGLHPLPRHGLYIFGQVGRGKSMLMDMFFTTAPIEAKRRVHFHQFMQGIHAALHDWRTEHPRQADPIPGLARTIAEDAWLLCLDELDIADIADAMIVGRLFQCLMDEGAVLVTTSNREPRDLYRDGLQRERFLPFIDLIEERLDLLHLDARYDYRMGRKKGMRVYHSPLGADADAALDGAFAHLTEGAFPHPDRMAVNGRTLAVPLAAAGVARFSFAELCQAALGPADYLALAGRYHTLVLAGIPTMPAAESDHARRFVTLVDVLYDNRVTLVCSAAAPADMLWPDGAATGECQRTVSRLMEMQSAEYLARHYAGQG
ncbi:MAG: cell division protein ZapE [Magnetospirillum sp.]|nr:cell division protein ZapE [Magnetospirillum sp.]